MAIHGCKASGCDRRISVNKLMCAGHWAGVPKSLQAECLAAYQKFRAAMRKPGGAAEAVAAGEELRQAQRKCVEAI